MIFILIANLLALFLSVFIAGALVGVLFSSSIRERVSTQIAKWTRRPELSLTRFLKNPILAPRPNAWEAAAVLNPAALVAGGRVHLFYRALGMDGVSRLGYASSKDGLTFDVRLPYPVYAAPNPRNVAAHQRRYNPVLYPSGGSWGGCEDPRVAKIDGRVYVTYNAFDGWDFIRVAVTSLSEEDLVAGRWNWAVPCLLSRAGERHKNWVLFPEKIHGKVAVLHSISGVDATHVRIEYVDSIETFDPSLQSFQSPDPHALPNTPITWHYRIRSAGPPPVKTQLGWLLFYHAMDPNEPDRYKLGAMLLDLEDPTEILHRSPQPVLEPDAAYENDGKPGIVYACGAVVLDGTLYVYYGGGDKVVAVATAPLATFLNALIHEETPQLAPQSLERVGVR
ncbi:MAG: hypothetical protein B7X04_03160 [Parcubacteria group bacterium 21-54-25]|nr:MAG: hypothetical protein B7X04_03160 [Parcubacteria group bacterium 21-54-25]HQU07988.1 hypothetical protein [Candidatus Paceibacterota bacterium]